VPAYGQVERFGGLEAATYGTATTTGLKGAIGEKAKFVYPVGMAVDSEDATARDKYAIYVLDNVNPQAVNLLNSPSTTTSLEYRIQKLNDEGNVLASVTFTLKSSTTEADLHAVSLAVDGPANRVYVLVADAPPESAGNEGHFNAALKIDAWTTALAPADGAGELVKDPETGVSAGELAGPDATNHLQGASFVGDVDVQSIAADGTGASAELALGGNRYSSNAGAWAPVIERIKTTGATAGEADGEWTNVAATENAAAQAQKTGQHSNDVYSLSANHDGSLNVSLGEPEIGKLYADAEPNMATVSGDLSATSAVLPWASAIEDTAPHTTAGQVNFDRAATDGFVQDPGGNGGEAFMPYGATPAAGTLAPSVVQLTGDNSHFPAGVYAGIVVHSGAFDAQNPGSGHPNAWRFAVGEEEAGTLKIATPASLGIRVFDAGGESLAMIGDTTPGHPCNLTSSPTEFNFAYRGGSFVGLAPGREGVLFALVQPDLLNTNATATTELVSPGSPVGAGMGDQVVEFAPGAGSPGAGQSASKWQECPQPSGGFSIANVTQPGSPITGTGEVAVLADTTLQFASEANLNGGAPWAYDWNLEGGVNGKGEGPVFNRPWTLNNLYTPTPEKGGSWTWPSPTIQAEYKTPGAYTATLNLVNDFGTLTAKRTVRVIAAGEITGAKVTVPAAAIVSQAVLLKASATLPAGDKIQNYHWDFGDGTGEDTGEAGEVEHSYSEAKSYTVTLTVTDALGKTAKASESVNVASPPPSEKPAPIEEKPAPKQEVPPPKQVVPPVVVKPKPLTNAQKLARALKLCKKKPKRQRPGCERLAKRKYGPKPRKRGAKR
jgi:hypothetical protein